MKSKRFRWITAAACTAALFAGTAALVLPTSHARADDMKTDAPTMDIIQTATGPGMEQVSTLVKAVQAAGLVDTLKGPGPFTVFAPTNAAFDKLPQTNLDMLMKPENKEQLAKILRYHVVSGDMSAKDVMSMTELKSLDDGKTLKIEATDNTTRVNDAKIIKPDIKCSNGTIHWIDAVLMPN